VHQAFRAGEIIIFDVRKPFQMGLNGAVDLMGFFIARPLFEELTARPGVAKARVIGCWSGAADPLVAHLGSALTPLFEQDRGAAGGFLEQVAMALVTHVAWRFGSVGP
jgi:hypothetical protein